MRHLPYEEQLSLLQSLAPRLPSDVVARVLSLSHTLSTEESANLGRNSIHILGISPNPVPYHV